MNLDTVTQYVLSIAPSAAAVISCVTALVVMIAKVKKVVTSSEKRIEAAKGEKAEREELLSLRRENAALKKEHEMMIKKLKGVRFEEE